MGLIARLIGCVLVAALGALAVVDGWARANASARPDAVLERMPFQPQALSAVFDAARLSEEDGAGAVLDASARRLAIAAPLAARPFARAGEAALNAGDVARAQDLLARATARDPRSPYARAWLALAEATAGDAAAALAHLVQLVRLDPDQSAGYREVIAGLAATPEGRARALALAAVDPEAAQIVFASLITNSGDYPLLLALAKDRPQVQAQLVQTLIRERGTTPAFIAWTSLLPDDMAQAFSWPFNPDFRDVGAPPPFNWGLNRRFALSDPRGGIVVSYSGRNRPQIASQLMLLRPGAYTLTISQTGEAQTRGGRLVWEARCHGGGPLLARLEPDAEAERLGDLSGDVVVPRDCDAQTLTLLGLPGELPMRTRARIHRVTIQPRAPGAGGQP